MAKESCRRRCSTSETTRDCSRAGNTRAYALTSIHDIASDLLELESRRRRRSASEITRNCSGAGDTRADALTTIHDIADDLLELVLLHIGSPVCLARAAATCKLWHRVIGGAGFHRRHRSLHAPRVLGHYHVQCNSGRADFVLSPAPPGEAAVDISSGRLGLGFLADRLHHLHSDLELNDSRGGLLLDASTGEFCSFTLPGLADIDRHPAIYERRKLRIVGVDAGVLRLARIVWDDLEVLQHVRGSGACVVERRVRLANLEAQPSLVVELL
ncbi:hypothetical protein ACP70R_032394 [Stipagrostis hirtigluma subsp. patula]